MDRKVSVNFRSSHINNWYFFITDQVEKGMVKIVHCPTDEIEADYMSKALQGAKFSKFKSSTLNL